MRFGEYLRECRKKRNMTLDGLSKNLGISRGYLSMIEKSMKRTIRRDLLDKIYINFDVDSEEYNFLESCIEERKILRIIK